MLLLVLHTFVDSMTPRNFGLVPGLERSSHFAACSERGVSLLAVLDRFRVGPIGEARVSVNEDFNF